MLSRKSLILATTALMGMLFGGEALAQSTGSRAIEAGTASEVEELVVTGSRGPRSVGGLIQAETAPKARTSITQEYIATQPAGQTIFQSLNQTPGLNFTNNDPYGASGGNVRLRGFDGNRVGLLWDGIPLNDTGNYATFTNQLLDPEIVEQVNVNTGTGDVDTPSPASVGGTINYTTLRPSEDFGLWVQPSVGSYEYRRVIGRVDSGELGPFNTRAFLSGSYQQYDKFRGPGDLERKQGNAYLFQEFRDSDFIGVGFHYNENRNSSYRTASLAQLAQFDYGLDNDSRCIRPTPVTGTAQNEAITSTVVTSQGQTLNNTSCTNFFGVRNNPSNTGNIRAQSLFNITDQLVLTFDPYFQYTLANGGGFLNGGLAETDGRLRGNSTAGGADLNGDGDILDTVQVYTPNNTNTRRYGTTASLLYALTDEHQFRVAYTVDYGRHRQTGEGGFLDFAGQPEDVFGGKDGFGRRLRAADNSFYRGRDRFSIASLQQVAAQYRGSLLEDRLIVDIGVRAPFFKRDLNQYCYTQNGTSNVLCTTQTPNTTLANGNVTFSTTGVNQYIRPYTYDVEYEDVLPNVGASYEFIDNHKVFASYAQGFAAPRTDNLYTATRLANGSLAFPSPEPEESKNYDLGYRYSSPMFQVYGTAFFNEFSNRIVTTTDPDTASPTFNLSVDRNVGSVDIKGLDLQVGYNPLDILQLTAFYSYIDAEVQENIVSVPGASAITLANNAIAGKQLVEVPENTFGGRVELTLFDGFDVGLQTKFVDSRFSNDLNTESAPAYEVWDFDARFDLARFGFEESYLQLNITNLFDEQYAGSISSATGSGIGFFQVGAPFTAQLTLRAGF